MHVTVLAAVAAAIAVAVSAPPANAANPVPDVRAIAGAPVIRAVAGTAPPPRYVRLRLDVTAYGVAGHGEIVVDRTQGRFMRRFDAGPVSEREGWDGTHPWRADATGMARIQGNIDERGAIRAWSRLLAPAALDAPCDCGSRAPEVTTDPATGRVTSVALHVGQETQHVSFGAYRRAGALVVPFLIENASDNGTWSARVRGVDALTAVAPGTFAPPPDPRDATLHGVVTVPLAGGSSLPVVDVSVNHAAPLHFLLDTGGQNAITPSAAQRVGLIPVGSGTVGGAGAALASVRYASARTVRVGTAEMRDQPFIVIDFGAGVPFDGIVGYELLARFAARIDFANETLQLAADTRAFGGSGVSVPMTFDERQPQFDGALDGIPGTVTIDTGSVTGAEVNAPFARAHDLAAHYHAAPVGTPIRGVGGAIRASLARADELRLGELRIRNVPLLIADATAGAEANPSIAINLGNSVLRRYTLVVDYRGGTIRFDTPTARPATMSP